MYAICICIITYRIYRVACQYTINIYIFMYARMKRIITVFLSNRSIYPAYWISHWTIPVSVSYEPNSTTLASVSNWPTIRSALLILRAALSSVTLLPTHVPSILCLPLPFLPIYNFIIPLWAMLILPPLSFSFFLTLVILSRNQSTLVRNLASTTYYV